MEQRSIIGIDPGAKGAAVVIVNAIFMDYCRFTTDSFKEALVDWWDLDNPIVFMEFVGPMQKDSRHAAFTFGKNTGKLYGLCDAYDYRIVEVAPQTWQRHFNLGAKFRSKTKRKNAHKAKAQLLFPNIKVTLDIADALLIAKYGWDITWKK